MYRRLRPTHQTRENKRTADSTYHRFHAVRCIDGHERGTEQLPESNHLLAILLALRRIWSRGVRLKKHVLLRHNCSLRTGVFPQLAELWIVDRRTWFILWSFWFTTVQIHGKRDPHIFLRWRSGDCSSRFCLHREWIWSENLVNFFVSPPRRYVFLGWFTLDHRLWIDSFLALLKDDGKPVDLKKKDWCLAGERKFVPVFQDASPLKKVKLDTAVCWLKFHSPLAFAQRDRSQRTRRRSSCACLRTLAIWRRSSRPWRTAWWKWSLICRSSRNTTSRLDRCVAWIADGEWTNHFAFLMMLLARSLIFPGQSPQLDRLCPDLLSERGRRASVGARLWEGQAELSAERRRRAAVVECAIRWASESAFPDHQELWEWR